MDFFPSFLRGTLIFTWGHSENRFSLFLSENNHFLGFVSKLHFWRFILPKTCFDLVAAKLQASSFISQKAAIQFLVGKHAAWAF